MGDELNRRTGKYWVLFYQPLPEAGERIAVALVFEDGKKVGGTLEYDPTFYKVSKLFPSVDPQALAFYLESIRADLGGANETQQILNAYGPQLKASSARRISVPVAPSTIEMLMTRYIYPEKKAKQAQPKRDKVADELTAFVRTQVGPEVSLRTHVGARDIFGRSVTGTKKVALAVSTNSGWTLIDGVDLNQLTPQAAVSRADDVARSFWNYGRAASDLGLHIKRVGVVLNGSSHLALKTHEAHDYALHRFETDSDAAIDAASTEAGQQLRTVLQHVGEH
jgi:hypothetical protein